MAVYSRGLILAGMVAAMIVAPGGAPRAGVIVDAAIAGPGLGTLTLSQFETGAPNNDNYTGVGAENPNFLVFEKSFDFSDVIDFSFEVEASQGITEYFLFETITNNTADSWDEYTLALGFGAGAAFTASLGGDGLSFDGTGLDITTFTALTATLDLINHTGGLVNPGDSFFLAISVDLPDVARFTLRQSPTAVADIPEPGTLMLFAFGLAGIGFSASRRRRAPCARVAAP